MELKKNDIKRIAACLRKTSLKFVPIEKLAHLVGLYPDIISDELAAFEPMIRFDPTINTKDLLPQLDEYLASLEEPKKKKTVSPRVVATKKEMSEYASIQDFVYKRMTNAGGLVDRSSSLSDKDLHILKKLVDSEVSSRRKAKKEAKKK